MSEIFRVCAVQAAPVFLNLDETLLRAHERIEAAAREGAELVVFPETWLAGYPAWIDAAPQAAFWNHPPAQALFTRLRQQSPEIDDPRLAALHATAHHHGCDVVMGLHERRGGTLYNTMAFYARDGRRRVLRRKLVPTYTERMLWGRGDGSTLGVLDTPRGAVGGMICWEHWMPALRQVMHAQNEVVHVAQWPTVHDLHQLASRQYAFEASCFVIASGGVLTRGQMIEGYRSLGEDAGLELLESLDGDANTPYLRGGSAIVAPDTHYVTEPVYDVECLVLGDLDLAAVDAARLTLDVDGHYSRPDLFTLNVDRNPQSNVSDA